MKTWLKYSRAGSKLSLKRAKERKQPQKVVFLRSVQKWELVRNSCYREASEMWWRISVVAVWERWVRMWWFSDEQEHNLDGNWTDASIICSDWLTACWLHLALGFSFLWLLEDLFGHGTTVFEAVQHHNLFCIEYSREWQEGWERRGNLGTALHFFSWVTQEGCGALLEVLNQR